MGQSLLLQNKFEEAPAILKEAAVTLTNRTNAEINEHYIESLIKSNQIQEALTESETAIKLGKSTAKIDDFYNGMIDPSALKEEAMINMTETLRKQMVNEKAPTGILLNSIGEEVSIKDFKGKTIVIDFWATWCPPCIVGLESMVEVVEKYKDQGDVVFLFVNTERINDKTKERVMHMLKEKDYSFNVFFDPNFKTTTSFKVEALPTKIVIDRNGKIRFFHVGLKGAKQQQSDELIAMIELAK